MQSANIVTQLFLPLALAFIMFTLGLTLTLADFRRVAVQPKDFLVGALCQIVLLPTVGLILVTIWPLDPALAVGVMIIASCPGGATSSLLTYLAKGDTALAVSLTAISSLLTIVTLPLIIGASIVYLMGGQTDGMGAADLSVGRAVGGIFAVITVPLAIGMAIRARRPAFAARLERPGSNISSALFVLIVAWAVYSERANIVDYFVQAGPVALALNVAMMGVAFALAKAARMGVAQRTAIVLECGLQNGTLAIFVAATLIGNTTMMVPGGIYSLLMFVTAALFLLPAVRGQNTLPSAQG